MKNHLKDLRAVREWTQADLADRVNVSRQTINAIEKGKFDPSLPLALRMATLFGVPVETIPLDVRAKTKLSVAGSCGSLKPAIGRN